METLTRTASMTDLDYMVNCAICSNELSEPTTMSCGHSFCRVCTINWCFVYKNYNCPTCRCALADKSLPNVNLTLKYLIALVKEKNLGALAHVELKKRMPTTTIAQSKSFDHERLMKKVMAAVTTSQTRTDTELTQRSDEQQNSKSSSNNSDSTLSRLNLVYFPFYLWMTIFGCVFLAFLNMVKRIVR